MGIVDEFFETLPRKGEITREDMLINKVKHSSIAEQDKVSFERSERKRQSQENSKFTETSFGRSRRCALITARVQEYADAMISMASEKPKDEGDT